MKWFITRTAVWIIKNTQWASKNTVAWIGCNSWRSDAVNHETWLFCRFILWKLIDRITKDVLYTFKSIDKISFLPWCRPTLFLSWNFFFFRLIYLGWIALNLRKLFLNRNKISITKQVINVFSKERRNLRLGALTLTSSTPTSFSFPSFDAKSKQSEFFLQILADLWISWQFVITEPVFQLSLNH